MTIATIDKSNAASVIDYLSQARTWLATCVEITGPAEIARAKAEIATAAEATKQLGLSKEIREDAAEMVRRAEYALRKATKKAQESGDVRSRGDNLIPGARTRNPVHPISSDERPSPREFFTNSSEYEDANAMGDLTEGDFEDVLTEAKAEGNLSRANVARKAREKSGKPKAAPRRALPDQFFDAAYDLTKVAERIDRLVNDDRFPQNAEKVGAKHRADLLRAVELLSKALDRLPS